MTCIFRRRAPAYGSSANEASGPAARYACGSKEYRMLAVEGYRMNINQIARIASLVGEPARTTMLVELMDGRALTANELAGAARITPQTASRHLAQLVDAGLLCVRPAGRHRYHSLASPDVAHMLEKVMQVASRTVGAPARTW